MPNKPSDVLAAHRAAVRHVVTTRNGRNPRIFGSVARGEDTDRGDLDLLVDTTGTTSLFDLAAIELELEALLGVPVHVTTSGALKDRLRDRVLADAELV